jgi:beta-aspartyl-dipeptidase (metallo-type)
MGHCHLLIGAGRILAISADKSELQSKLAIEVDLGGRTVVPGFIDGHAHVTGGGGESGFASRVPPVPLSRFTSAGVTSVVGLLGTDDTTRDTRALLAQVRGLREDGLGAWCHTGGYHLPPQTLTGSVRDDIVHLDPVIGVGEVAISDHRSSQPTLNELLRVASDAHVAGLISGKAGILHIHLGDGRRGLELVSQALHDTELPPRVFNPTHVNRRKSLFDEALAMSRLGVTIDITAFPVGDTEDAWRADVALEMFLDSDAPRHNVTVSSDGGGCLPVFDDQGQVVSMGVGDPSGLGIAFAALLDRGVPVHRALPAFTSNVAGLLRLGDRGRVACGMAADLLVLDDTYGINDVMIAGRWHVRDREQQVLGRFEHRHAGSC